MENNKPTYQELENEIIELRKQLSETKKVEEALNITERKQAEEELRKSEANLNNFFNLNIDFLWVLDESGNIITVNDTVKRRLGYKEEELVGKSVLVVHPPHLHEKAGEIVQGMLKGELDSCPIPIMTKGGNMIPVETYITPGKWNGKPALFGVSKDISKLKLSEEKFAKAFHTNPSIMGLSDLETGEYIEVNQSFYDILGFEPGEVIGRRASDVVKLDKEFRDKTLAELKKNGSIHNVEGIIYAKDGRRVDVLLSAEVIQIQDKKYNFTTAVDITDRKQAEEALQKSQQMNKTMLKAMPDLMFVIDKNYVFRAYNSSSDKDLYAPPEVFLGKHVDEVLPQDVATLTKENVDKVLQSGKMSVYEYHIELAGKTRFYDARMVLQEENLVLTINRDITKRKQAEEELKKNEKKYRELSTFLRLMADNLPDMIWAKNLNKEYIFVNKAICTDLLNAKDTDEPLGKTDIFFAQRERNAHPDNPEWHTFGEVGMDSDSATLEAMKPMQFDEFGNVKGKFMFLDVHKAPLYDSDGQLIGVIGSARDVTAAKEAENQIRKLSTAVTQSPVTIVITDINGNIEYVNPKFEELTGYTLKEALGKNSRVLKSGEHSEEYYKNLWETISSGNIWTGEFHNKKKNGELFWESALISPIRNSKGEITHFLAIKEDITEKKKMIEELVAAKEKAEESDRLKSAFLANMSHEIRTPMNGILGFANLLKEPDLSGDEQQEYIKIIEKSGKRMLNIINDIVDISKIEAGLMKTYIKETNINEQLAYIYTFFKPEAEAKGIELSLINSFPAKDATIKTDPEKLYAIFTNLVKNAIKYTEKGTIILGYEKKEKYFEFYVKDTGIGIPKDRQEAIFERFIQADIEDRMARQGAGLGLAITRAYIEMLGGRIWVESTEGIGSTFYFTLPYDTERTGEINEQTEIVEQNETNKKFKILIAEDDEASIILLKKMLENTGKEFLIARTGIEAVEICRNNSDINLVLIDIQMPDLNGYEATRQIREFNKDVVIIAQTAFALSGDREKALEAGSNDYIAKPIKKDRLLAFIKKYFK